MKKKVLVISFQSLNHTSAAAIAMIGYYVSGKLHQGGLLQNFVVSSKGKFSTEFPTVPVNRLSRYYLYLVNKLPLKSYISRYLQEILYDRFCSLHVTKETGIILTTNPYLYHTFRKARKHNVKIYFLPGNPEDNYINQLMQEECSRYGLAMTDGYTFQPRLDYYNKSMKFVDKIVLFSSVMYESYCKAGYKDKVIRITGYLKPEMKPVNSNDDKSIFRIAFFANNVLLKGLQYTLEAWKGLQHLDKIELHIGGPIDPMVQKIIDTQYSQLANVTYDNRVIHDIPDFFSDKSLYILTSIVDGAPVSILEAMTCTLPVICSEACGTKDIIEEGKNGWVVPTRDVDAIRQKMLEAYNNKKETVEMGLNAQRKITDYSIDEFVNQIINVIIPSHSS